MSSYKKSPRTTREFTHTPRENASIETSYLKGRLEFERRNNCCISQQYGSRSDIFTYGGVVAKRTERKRLITDITTIMAALVYIEWGNAIITNAERTPPQEPNLEKAAD